MHPQQSLSLAKWLLFCALMVGMMVWIGGVTRLTDSGLSITQWKPITGGMPPITQANWDHLFNEYQQTPEFKLVNRNMSLSEFKKIFWFEWTHRLIGRLTAMVFFIPFVYFLHLRAINKKLMLQLLGVLCLGALQGAMGWYMVKSGLVNRVDVSQYRLTAHLLIAFSLYASLIWLSLSQTDQAYPPDRDLIPVKLRLISFIITALIFTQIGLGGFVAGLKAGYLYNTFPLMGDHFLPPEYNTLVPFYKNFFENHALVQFNHRILAYVTFISICLFWFFSLKYPLTPVLKQAITVLLIVGVCQVLLGIATLLSFVSIPIASLHQMGAVLLFGTAIFINHRMVNTHLPV
ncbi:MAG: COX15/CtaA family protein [Alphaproteobacteria bacterium]|nr:COX15/CtaA family protein [Alphaproteobacteria bacterium]